MTSRVTPLRWWSNEIARLTADAAISALIHAHRHRDTNRLIQLLTVLPREKRWEYAQWIHGHSPIRVTAVAGKILTKIQKPGDALFREFDLSKAARSIPEAAGLTAVEPLLAKAFAKKIKEIHAYVVRYGPRTAAYEVAIKERALAALAHANTHGDVGRMRQVVESLPLGYWEQGFNSWLYTFSPIRRNVSSGRFYQAKLESPEFRPYDLTGASLAAIIPNAPRFSIRRLFDDDAYAQWANHLATMSHLEILGLFENCVAGIVNGHLQENPSAKRVINAFTAEWRLRSDMDDYFKWPSTCAAPGSIPMSSIEAPELGIFAALGYRVGKARGQPDAIRLFLLNYIFSSTLPPLNSADYMRSWSLPNTAARLRKMAHFLASEIKNGKRKVSQDMSVAVAQWNNDYNYLYRKYYVGRFKFALSSTLDDG